MKLKRFNLYFNFEKAGYYALIALIVVGFFCNLAVSAERGEIISADTNFQFYGGSNFHSFQGRINKFKGFIFSDSKDVKNVNYIQLEFDPFSFSTQNTARDENMRKVLSSSVVQFRSTNVLLSHDGAFVDITGRLIIKNVSKRVVFTALLSKPSAKTVKATGSFWIKLSDYNLKPQAPGFIRLNDKVQVKFQVVSTWPH